MAQSAAVHSVMPLGIVVRKSPGVTRWAKWSWRAVAILPGAGQAEWSELRSEGDTVEYHAATLPLTLWAAETESYLDALSARVPCVYVVMRESDSDDQPLDMVLVTASTYEAQDYADSGEELVEKIPMTEGLVAWVREFVTAHHVEEVFIKRKRDKTRVDLKEDGKGDSRISQMTDVYRAPRRKGSEVIH